MFNNLFQAGSDGESGGNGGYGRRTLGVDVVVASSKTAGHRGVHQSDDVEETRTQRNVELAKQCVAKM